MRGKTRNNTSSPREVAPNLMKEDLSEDYNSISLWSVIKLGRGKRMGEEGMEDKGVENKRRTIQRSRRDRGDEKGRRVGRVIHHGTHYKL